MRAKIGVPLVVLLAMRCWLDAWGGGSAMPDKDSALPGREEPMAVSERHYVLGTPIRGPWPVGLQRLVFANGCFWGSEKGIWRLPGGGIHSTAVGYAAGFTPNPTYEEVVTGMTGHAEAVQVIFDPTKIGLVDILRWFWEAHDPTQGMGQGNDKGTQYRSGLYYFDDDQRALFAASLAAYQEALHRAGKLRQITTEILPAAEFDEVFYYAEDYHQQYLAKPGSRPYCSAQPQRVSLPPFHTWASDSLKERFDVFFPEEFWVEHAPVPHGVVRAPTGPIQWSLAARSAKPARLAEL